MYLISPLIYIVVNRSKSSCVQCNDADSLSECRLNSTSSECRMIKFQNSMQRIDHCLRPSALAAYYSAREMDGTWQLAHLSMLHSADSALSGMGNWHRRRGRARRV